LTAVSPPLLDEAVFHCQQAAEKAFKGFLTWHGCTFRKTHNLEEIGEQCLAIDPSLHEFVDQAVPLSEYAWRFRYPGEPAQPGPEEVAEALATARAVFEALATRMPADVRA
jgi:HEPN domain-containing protein